MTIPSNSISASASGKIILLGEHTVVYGQPAIAIPVSNLRAEATITENQGQVGEIWIDAPTIRLYKNIQDLKIRHPLRVVIEKTLAECKTKLQTGLTIHINSALPVAGGMGSGAAVSCAIIRALSTYLLGTHLDLETINHMVFEIEKIHHGNPSGIDNTVITYEKPVFFQKNKILEFISVKISPALLIADTGIRSETSVMIEGVKKRFDKNPTRYEIVFKEIGEMVKLARSALEIGNFSILADAMNNNHSLLQELEVSCYSLDRLVQAARNSGAMAAKLTGAGGGGSMLALVSEDTRAKVSRALEQTGAVRVIPFKLQT